MEIFALKNHTCWSPKTEKQQQQQVLASKESKLINSNAGNIFERQKERRKGEFHALESCPDLRLLGKELRICWALWYQAEGSQINSDFSSP